MAFKGDDSKFSIATTVTLALAVAAMVLVKEPLKSSRPAGAGGEINGTSKEMEVRARLWEDPFAAVQKDVGSRKKSGVTVTGEGTLSQASGAAPHKPSETMRMTIKAQAGSSSDDGPGRVKDDAPDRVTSDESMTALIMMTAGGPYANDIESRIEDRYALESALDVGCFVPESTEFLRYFTWQFTEKADATPYEVATPYEWYSRNRIARCGDSKERVQRVLVLWVKTEDYKEHILKGIDDLIQQIPRVTNKKDARSENVRFKVIGPRNSSEFEGILREIEQRQQSIEPLPFSWSSKRQQLDLHSPWATAMPGLLANRMKGKDGVQCDSYRACKEVFNDLLAQSDVRLGYRIDSDKILFDELFRELDRRQVIIGQDPIVLIGEWDSFYARALPITFSAAACHYISNATIAKSNPPSEDMTRTFNGKCATTEDAVNALMKGEVWPQDLNITRYGYLSGLDGESLEDQQKRSKSKGEDKEKESTIGARFKPRDSASYEKPEGTSQLDYVRRLVSRIESDAVAQRRKVKAIGILGRDAYDALLILQAVREQFPTALFFATDLDARYFHESEQKWTRNLLIVSHFGLQLDRQLQQAIPPFRNTYQTSTFLAVLRAIDHVAHRAAQGECQNAQLTCYVLNGNKRETVEYSTQISTRLFEIGRRGAVDLSVNTLPTGMKSVHPSRNDVEPGTTTVKLPDRIGTLWIVFLVVLALFIWSYGKLWNWLIASGETDDKARVGERLLRVGLLAVPLLCLFLLWYEIQGFNYEGDEPFSWSDGVSIWPTELLRLLAGMLCLGLLIKARADLTENTQVLTSRFFPEHQSKDGPPDGFLKNLAASWRNRDVFWRNLDWMVHGSKRGNPIPEVALWSQYCQAHTWPQRMGRVALLILVYGALISPIWYFMNEGEGRLFVPCRGSFSCSVDSFAIGISVGLLIGLNLSVLDAVLLCARWINEMSASSELSELAKIRLIAERTRIVNRRVLYPFLVLFIVIAARSHYFDNWDFPPALIVGLTVNSLVALASACMLYLAAVGARRRVLAPIQEKLDRSLTDDENADPRLAPAPSSDRLRQLIGEIDSIQQGAFVPFYQQPVVQATLVAALAFLQYWYLGQ